MPIDLAHEKYSGSVYTVELGANLATGGTRDRVIKIGGDTTLPFLFEEGSMPNSPVVGLEIFDCEPTDWPDGLKDQFGDAIKDPIKWAKRALEEFDSKFLCVRLMSAHPDWGKRPPSDVIAFLKSLLEVVKVPLVIIEIGRAHV